APLRAIHAGPGCLPRAGEERAVFRPRGRVAGSGSRRAPHRLRGRGCHRLLQQVVDTVRLHARGPGGAQGAGNGGLHGRGLSGPAAGGPSGRGGGSRGGRGGEDLHSFAGLQRGQRPRSLARLAPAARYALRGRAVRRRHAGDRWGAENTGRGEGPARGAPRAQDGSGV
ncbi:MAG: hypothetical protein AVDCRST_MAG55-2405, partial [uncultured Rubrobacteraceae bacterium]